MINVIFVHWNVYYFLRERVAILLLWYDYTATCTSKDDISGNAGGPGNVLPTDWFYYIYLTDTFYLDALIDVA